MLQLKEEEQSSGSSSLGWAWPGSESPLHPNPFTPSWVAGPRSGVGPALGRQHWWSSATPVVSQTPCLQLPGTSSRSFYSFLLFTLPAGHRSGLVASLQISFTALAVCRSAFSSVRGIYRFN